jgi:hypothetical protein
MKEKKMAHKRFWLGMLLMTAALLFVGCGGDKKSAAGGIVPQVIKDAVINAPDDVIIGIGVAKTESDGESILLAEDRARTEIATLIETHITDTERKIDYENGTNMVENTVVSRTVTRLYNAQVVLREKDKNGKWWCVVYASKGLNKPITDDIFEILRSNAAELTALTELKREITRYGETVTVYENTSSIPSWVFEPYQYKAEDVVFGLGAAKSDNDEDSIRLAKERARRSLAHSLDAQVTSVYYTFQADNTELYEEVNTSVTSVYDHTAIPTLLFQYAKTKDGTYWVMLYCPIQYETVNFFEIK